MTTTDMVMVGTAVLSNRMRSRPRYGCGQSANRWTMPFGTGIMIAYANVDRFRSPGRAGGINEVKDPCH